MQVFEWVNWVEKGRARPDPSPTGIQPDSTQPTGAEAKFTQRTCWANAQNKRDSQEKKKNTYVLMLKFNYNNIGLMRKDGGASGE